MPRHCEDISVIIPTTDRVPFLERCLSSISTQTVRPVEIIVVAAMPGPTALTDLVARYARSNPDVRIDLIFSRAGTATQRNLGAERATGKVLLFLDDDVILSPQFLGELVKPFTSDNANRVGGVQGIVTEVPKARSGIRSILTFCYAVLFLQSRTADQQVVLRSGKYVGYPARDPVQGADYSAEYSDRIQWMSGCCMSVRREVFHADGIRFDQAFEVFGPFAYMEDGDFSYRVFLKGYRLVRTGRAVCFHSGAPGSRRDLLVYYSSKVYNHYLFWRKNIPFGLMSVVMHIWSQAGTVLEATIRSMMLRDLAPLRGIRNGLVFCARAVG